MAQLYLAATLFVVLHLVLSSVAVRTPLIAKLGQGFQGLYSVCVLAPFVWMLWLYGDAPAMALWNPPLWARWIPNVVMPVAMIFLVLGFTAKSPTAVGQEKLVDQQPQGILRVTRHPGLWSFALWGLAHLCTNGESKNIALMSSMVALAILGMLHIDARRAQALGARWEAYAAQTSLLPFLAIFQGRQSLQLGELGTLKVVIALALWAGMLHGHRWLTGMSALPIF